MPFPATWCIIISVSSHWEHRPNPQTDAGNGCTFCRIIENEAPARVAYQDDDVIAIYNLLQWVPVMLMVIPKKHMSQGEMWQDPIIAKIASVAVQVGAERCPEGFRLLSNFGHQAMQSQPHGHLHVLGGAQMGRYV